MKRGNAALVDFIRVVVNGPIDEVVRRLADDPSLATAACEAGATRQDASIFFVAEIAHYVYRGDTALHMAAAAFRAPVAALLIEGGASCDARNRRGAEPLHYAADTNDHDPSGQAEVIAYLTSHGANPDAIDVGGVTPLHRAVRTRSLAAVKALVEAGANPRRPNKSGSTPLHLAVQTTGRGNSGSDEAYRQQAGIIQYLLAHGARLTDRDGRGRQVVEAASGERIRELLVETAG